MTDARAATAARLASPVGELAVAVDAGGRLLRLHFTGGDDGAFFSGLERAGYAVQWSIDPPGHVADALTRYFDGDRDAFEYLELRPGGTPFQQRVWLALRAIPYGRTRTYGEVAEAVGRPSAARAVGMANNANPIAIVVPCHRVIGANGRLVGFAAGLEHKQALLAHEQREELLFS